MLIALRGKPAVKDRAIRACVLLFATAVIVRPVYPQTPSRSAQVVLIARMPDAFSVHFLEAAQETRQEMEPLSTAVAFQTVEHLIPGTTVTSSCLIARPRGGHAVLADTDPPITVREGAADSTCDGIFRDNLPERIARLKQAISAVKNQESRFQDARLDIFFSAL